MAITWQTGDSNVESDQHMSCYRPIYAKLSSNDGNFENMIFNLRKSASTIATWRVPPDIGQTVECTGFFDRVIQDHLSYDIPQTGDNAIDSYEATNSYDDFDWVGTKEEVLNTTTGLLEDGDTITQPQTTTFYAHNITLPLTLHPLKTKIEGTGNDYLEDYVIDDTATAQKFLTNVDEFNIDPLQNSTANIFLQCILSTASTYHIVIRTYLQSGVLDTTFSIGSVSGENTRQVLKVGMTNWQNSNSAQFNDMVIPTSMKKYTAKYYTVTLESSADGLGTAYSESKRINLIVGKSLLPTTFFYLNEFGAFDTVTFYTAPIISGNRTHQLWEQKLDKDWSAVTSDATGKEVLNVLKNEEVEIDTGHLTRSQSYQLEELLTSQKVFVDYNIATGSNLATYILPVIITNTNYKKINYTKRLQSYMIKYRLANDNIVQHG